MFANFLASAGFKKYLGNTLWALFEKILKIVFTMFIGIWIARYLGPSQFGLLSFAQSLAGMFAPLATLGITTLLLRDLVGGKLGASALLSTSFILVQFASILTYALVASFIFLAEYGANENLLTMAVAAAIIFQISSVLEAYFQSRVQAKVIAYCGIIGLVQSSIVKVLLIYFKAPVYLFGISIAFDAAIILVAYLVFFVRQSNFKFADIAFSIEIAKYLLKQSWPYILSGILVSIYMKIDQIMIKQMMNDYSVGQYAAAARLSEAWYFIPMTVVVSLYPAIMSAKNINEEIYKNRLSNLYSLMIYSSVAISLIVAFSAEWIVNLLFGASYAEAASVLVVHIWASVFVFIGVSSGKWLLTEGLQVYSAINTLIGALINVGLNYLWIPKFGLSGVAWATLISYAFAAYFCLAFWKVTRPGFWAISRSIFRFPKLK